MNEQGEVVAVFLYGTRITVAGLVHLKGITGLEVLDLSGTQVTDAGVAELKDPSRIDRQNSRNVLV